MVNIPMDNRGNFISDRGGATTPATLNLPHIPTAEEQYAAIIAANPGKQPVTDAYGNPLRPPAPASSDSSAQLDALIAALSQPQQPIVVNYPDYSSIYGNQSGTSAGKTAAQKLEQEAADQAKLQPRVVGSIAQGVSSRLRTVTGSSESTTPLSVPTLLGMRGTGGQTSLRRTRLQQNY